MEFLAINELNFIPLLDHCCGDPTVGVLQSAFALVGDLSKNCFKFLEPHLHSILSKLTNRILNTTTSVSNNAGWAIGEIATHISREKLEPHFDEMLPKFSILLLRKEVHSSLLQNTCITLGRLGYVSPKFLAKYSLQILKPWCGIMTVARNDPEKVHAFEGICAMISEHPEVVLHCLPEFCRAILSFNPCPPSLQQLFHIILDGLGRTYPDQWNTFWNNSSVEIKEELSKRFYFVSEQR
ncbi:HEAT repeat-containing protein [Cardiosporidium cionae]|uniref:HEAT repeat-containing protein n=1 Tax=Cardiosporidium cionae TaxID=476202 RepID=A0ABQ7J755_9APIC|nr:HEAT repeat-containing protein [Cardiosporidium cionae]|eukprot:KAF8819822.1 HEAT repeat-containing protein [Cardiosporidium cionae]